MWQYGHLLSNSKNDLQSFKNKSEVITALIHLGYFAYDVDRREAYVPNKEIQEVFYQCMKDDENSLSCTIMIALITVFTYYHQPIRKFLCGKGFADTVYLPLPNHSNRPIIVIELKWDKNANTTISQIKKKQYPKLLRGYAGDILLVGIDYDKKTKEYICEIESFSAFECVCMMF